jgi:hypothetical protein
MGASYEFERKRRIPLQDARREVSGTGYSADPEGFVA